MTWTEVTDAIEVPARPEGIWTLVLDYVQGPALLKVEAKGTWQYSPSRGCGPDGDLNTLVSAGNAILAEAPVGALLIKVGGSTAGIGDGVVRVAGSYAVVQLDHQASGPIFLTINDELTGLSDNGGQLEVRLSIAQPTEKARMRTDQASLSRRAPAARSRGAQASRS